MRRTLLTAAAEAIPGNKIISMPAAGFDAGYENAGDVWVYPHLLGLPEVHTQRVTLEEAREMVLDAIALVLEGPPPAPGVASVSDEA